MNARLILFVAVVVALCSVAAQACSPGDELSCGQAWRCPNAVGADRCNCVTQYLKCLADKKCAVNEELKTAACDLSSSSSSSGSASEVVSSSSPVVSSSAVVSSGSASEVVSSGSASVVASSSAVVSSGSSHVSSSSVVESSSAAVESSSSSAAVESSSVVESSSSSGIEFEGCKNPFTIGGIAYQVSAPSTWENACKNIGETLAGIDYANFVQVASKISSETWIASWNTDSYDGVPLVFLPNSVFTINDGKSRPALCTCHGGSSHTGSSSVVVESSSSAAVESSSSHAGSSSEASYSSSSSAAVVCDYVWTNWTACSAPCGEGNSTRTAPALPLGESCPALQETRVCNLGNCQVESEAPQVECAEFTLNGKAVQFIASPTTHSQACVEFGETLVGVNAADIATVAGIVPTQAWIAHWNGDSYGGKINLAFTNPGAVNVWGDDARFGSLCTDSKPVCENGEIIASSSHVSSSSEAVVSSSAPVSSSEAVVSSSAHVSSSEAVVSSSVHVSSSEAVVSSSVPVSSSEAVVSSSVHVSSSEVVVSSSAPVVSSGSAVESSSAPVVSSSVARLLKRVLA